MFKIRPAGSELAALTIKTQAVIDWSPSLLQAGRHRLILLLRSEDPKPASMSIAPGRHPLCAVSSPGGNGTSQVLAEDPQSKRSDVLERVRRDFGCDRTLGICQDHGAALPAAGQVRLQPALPGTGAGVLSGCGELLWVHGDGVLGVAGHVVLPM